MFRNNYIHDFICGSDLKLLKVLVEIMLAQRCRWWPSITSVLGQCSVLSGVSDAGILKVTNIKDGTIKEGRPILLFGTITQSEVGKWSPHVATKAKYL